MLLLAQRRNRRHVVTKLLEADLRGMLSVPERGPGVHCGHGTIFVGAWSILER